MKIEKIIKSKILREYYFIKGNIPIDTKYFIKKIEEGINLESNKNYKTNVIGQMTSWNFFIDDKKFIKIMLPIFDIIDNLPSEEINSWNLREAWGFKESFSEYTRKHSHLPSFISGAIQLSKHNQILEFPQINETLESKPGNFAVFSSFLLHKNKRNIIDKPRYGLSFNIECK